MRETLGESVVYGCIRDISGAKRAEHRRVNRQAMQELPAAETWSLVNREMFSMPDTAADDSELHTSVVHFGAAYQYVEHEWEQWLKQFEDLLRKMYWVSATVHLETELSGVHAFEFAPESKRHDPKRPSIRIRCEWSKDSRA